MSDHSIEKKTNPEDSYLLAKKSTNLYSIAYLVGHRSPAEETHLYDTFSTRFFINTHPSPLWGVNWPVYVYHMLP